MPNSHTYQPSPLPSPWIAVGEYAVLPNEPKTLRRYLQTEVHLRFSYSAIKHTLQDQYQDTIADTLLCVLVQSSIYKHAVCVYKHSQHAIELIWYAANGLPQSLQTLLNLSTELVEVPTTWEFSIPENNPLFLEKYLRMGDLIVKQMNIQLLGSQPLLRTLVRHPRFQQVRSYVLPFLKTRALKAYFQAPAHFTGTRLWAITRFWLGAVRRWILIRRAKKARVESLRHPAPLEDVLAFHPYALNRPAMILARSLHAVVNQEALWFLVRRTQRLDTSRFGIWFKFLALESGEAKSPGTLRTILGLLTPHTHPAWMAWSMTVLAESEQGQRLLRVQLERAFRQRLSERKGVGYSALNQTYRHIQSGFQLSTANLTKIVKMHLYGGSAAMSLLEKYGQGLTARGHKLLLGALSVPEILTLLHHPRKHQLPSVFQVLWSTPAFQTRLLEIRLLCVMKVRRFVRCAIERYRGRPVGECTICWDEGCRLYTLHDGDVRHGVCFGCRKGLLLQAAKGQEIPRCPMCRVKLHEFYTETGRCSKDEEPEEPEEPESGDDYDSESDDDYYRGSALDADYNWDGRRGR
jgi:hypothetical protein